MKKHTLQFIVTVNTFFCQFADRKVADSAPKYTLLAGDTNQVSNFCPCVR